jgi:hypothetical protein
LTIFCSTQNIHNIEGIIKEQLLSKVDLFQNCCMKEGEMTYREASFNDGG